MTHYFINDEDLKSEVKQLKITINNKEYTFYTDNGLFAKKGLDFGTRILLESLPVNNISGKVLDVGCGYGPIGIYLALNTKASIQMIDVNSRAVTLVNKTINQLKLKNVTAYESNVYEKVNGKFDFIVTNPPIRAGKKVVYNIIFEAKKLLNIDGQLWLVIRKQQGAQSLIKDMEKEYKIEIVNKKNGFFVISAKIR